MRKCRTHQPNGKHLAHKALAEIEGIEWRYLANIENKETIPSLPVAIQLIKTCWLPVERYFNSEVLLSESEQRQRAGHKLKLCPKEYLPIIEGAIDGVIKMNSRRRKKRGCLKTILYFLLFTGDAKASFIFLHFFQEKPVFCGQFKVFGTFY